jgi:hypothetical protein
MTREAEDSVFRASVGEAAAVPAKPASMPAGEPFTAGGPAVPPPPSSPDPPRR